MNNVPNIVQPAQPAPKVIQGKWGYYPADYETCQKLKKLNRAYQKTYSQIAAWERWDRKAPQNRLLRRKIRNDKNQVIGREVIGPAPEPYLNPVFLETYETPAVTYGSYTIPARKHIRRTARSVGFYIPAEYAKSRYPMPTAEQVAPLLITSEQIDAMLKDLGE